jgi:exopolysaccharide production protein ExoQ
MPLSLGLLVWLALPLVLLRWSKDPTEASARALWIPVIWLLIISSRLPSQWLGLRKTSITTAIEEGSSLDRTIFLVLIVLSLWILTTRRLNWAELFARNSALMWLLVFALASVAWSDFPFVAFKRWIRDLGIYVMVLIVLSDRRPQMAIVTVIRRFSCILLFLSLILIKYYPQFGVLYDQWSGLPEYVGATTSKNMLGVVCLISGLFYFWDTMGRWAERKTPAIRRVLFANITLIAIMMWVLRLSNSATSQACLILGLLIMTIIRSNWAKSNPRRVTIGIPVALAVFVILEFVFGISSVVVQLLGRDPTLTGRTGIWDAVLQVQTSPLFGVGYQSFWMGDRLAAVWRILSTGSLNEAHNGYLETYLNLGCIGLSLLLVFMVSSYRTMCRQLAVFPHFTSLGLTLWTITVFYNFTESAFGASLLWGLLLLCAMVVPRSDKMPPQRTESIKRQTATAPQAYAIRTPMGE